MLFILVMCFTAFIKSMQGDTSVGEKIIKLKNTTNVTDSILPQSTVDRINNSQVLVTSHPSERINGTMQISFVYQNSSQTVLKYNLGANKNGTNATLNFDLFDLTEENRQLALGDLKSFDDIRNIFLNDVTKKNKDNADLRRSITCPLRKPADEWMHCQDLITPFIKGIRTNITHIKMLKVDTKGGIIVRTLYLLKHKYEPGVGLDDLKGVLKRIALTKMRLFQWAPNAIRLLLDTIIKSHEHTFIALRKAIRKMLKDWLLDYSDTMFLLQHTTLFKPMCVTVVNYLGSTMSHTAMQYPKPEKPSTQKVCDFVCMQREAKRKIKRERRREKKRKVPPT